MKANSRLKRFLVASAAALAVAVLPLNAATVEFSWDDAERYTDLSVRSPGSNDLEQFKRAIEPYVERMAQQRLPDGAVLRIEVKDVDLAGEFEPWRVDHDVRIVRDIYPPRIEFDYQIARDGEVVKEGSEQLADMGFRFNIGRRFFDQDEFFYEKEMLGAWIREEFG